MENIKEIIEFRKKSIVRRILDFIGGRGFPISKFDFTSLEISLLEEGWIDVNYFEIKVGNKTENFDNKSFIPLISPKSKKMLKYYGPDCFRMKLIIHSYDEYEFEPIYD